MSLFLKGVSALFFVSFLALGFCFRSNDLDITQEDLSWRAAPPAQYQIHKPESHPHLFLMGKVLGGDKTAKTILKGFVLFLIFLSIWLGIKSRAGDLFMRKK